VPGDAGVLLSGLVIGDDDAMSFETREQFYNLGMSHITAVSGSNLALLTWLLLRAWSGRRPIVVGGTGLYLRAALADLSFKRPAPGEISELWSEETRHPTLLCGLVMERTELYERIEERVDAIVAAGAEAQARAADAGGASRTSRKALGFQELLEGDIHGLKRRTRNYARRQLTWMRKMPGVLTIDVTARTPSCVADEIAAALP